ncbi:MAG: replicative DNA helicase [Clostridia bacterium]|nr:replicative DNA helicase [Clostridia bacterium]
MEEQLTKKLPFSLIAEQSLLGAILVDPEALNDIADSVNSTDFYLTEHSQIFTAMHELFLANKEIDIVTLIDMLVTKGIYSKSGGQDYIKTLCQTVPNALNIKDYAAIVKQKSLLRQLIDVCSDISDTAFSEEGSANEIIDYAESRIFDIAQGRDTKNFRHIREVIGEVYKNLHTMATEGESAQGTKTGFSGVDNLLAGMGDSDLVLIGARPGMGKTSFALNIATNVALQTKKKVCLFSLEMSAEQLVSRVISSEAMVDSYALRTGKLDNKQWDDIAAATSKLAGCDILIDDTSGISVTAMKAKLRRITNLGLVVIDYLQLMQSDRRNDNRVQEVADISRALKIMAKELNVPVICCAQLSRGPESRTDKRPMLSDLRDSGAIEQDADTVIFLYRDEYYKTEGNQDEGNIAEVIIAKNRHGSTGNVKMGWIGRFTKFRTLATETE